MSVHFASGRGSNGLAHALEHPRTIGFILEKRARVVKEDVGALGFDAHQTNHLALAKSFYLRTCRSFATEGGLEKMPWSRF